MSHKVIVLKTILTLLLYYHIINNPTLARQLHEKKDLRVGFYKKICPQAEEVVNEVVKRAVHETPGVAASLIRLQFHDCIVQGCDASILLDSTPSSEPTEKSSRGNYGVRGFDIVDEIKMRLEAECLETVSCADIIALAARDAVVLSGLTHYKVPTGRRDGVTSLARNIPANLPFPEAELDHMEEIFNSKGLNYEDLVVLLGSHSIGVAHCSIISKNLYNFSSANWADPNTNKQYASYLRSVCPNPGSKRNDEDKSLPLNTILGDKLSSAFYVNLLHGIDPIKADMSLLGDIRTKELVDYYAWRSFEWGEKFKKAMVKMGKVEVLTGLDGQVRRSCRVVNQ